MIFRCRCFHLDAMPYAYFAMPSTLLLLPDSRRCWRVHADAFIHASRAIFMPYVIIFAIYIVDALLCRQSYYAMLYAAFFDILFLRFS